MKKGKHEIPVDWVAPIPYGAHVTDKGVRFTLFSRHATTVRLMLFHQPEDERPFVEYDLDPEKNRLGNIWYIEVEDAAPGQFYLYRIEGTPPKGHTDHYHPRHWLLDPYARAIAGHTPWGNKEYYRSNKFPKGGARFPKAVIVADEFDWSDDVTPAIPMSDTILYEAHVRSYTVHESSGVGCPGTYRGFMEKIPHLKELGITAVEFLPIHEFNELEYYFGDPHRRDLHNLWGYSTVGFFAPNGRYAHDGVVGQQIREFKELVRALHQANIEVILDVVYNHTAEGGPGATTYSFRGIDNSIYYMLEKDGRHYRNYTGCGNTVNCNHPVVMDFILNSLRYWMTEFHVDGFRFDLASIFMRDQNGNVLDHPPIVERISHDPVLRDCKLIAEAWDASGLYQVGSFPGRRWSEWNGRYRDDVRKFWRGDTGMLSPFATRLAGSADLYDRKGQTPQKSINYVACHDGFTMRDLVSYTEKHNEANGEHNRDGDSHNHSYNHGEEGDTDNPHIRAIRKRQVKNFIATVMLSQGVPMLLAGDEMFRTQNGNNNAYCQDNEISWLNWNLANEHKDLIEFTRRAVAFRKAHPSLRRTTFLKGARHESGEADIHWLGPDGQTPHWESGSVVGCLMNGLSRFTGAEEDRDHLLMLFNASDQQVNFSLPTPPGKPWAIGLTTEDQELASSEDPNSITLDARSVNVLVSAVT